MPGSLQPQQSGSVAYSSFPSTFSTQEPNVAWNRDSERPVRAGEHFPGAGPPPTEGARPQAGVRGMLSGCACALWRTRRPGNALRSSVSLPASSNTHQKCQLPYTGPGEFIEQLGSTVHVLQSSREGPSQGSEARPQVQPFTRRGCSRGFTPPERCAFP